MSIVSKKTMPAAATLDDRIARTEGKSVLGPDGTENS